MSNTTREEAQTVIDKFVSNQESACLTNDQIDELVFGEARTVEPFAWVTQCKASGLIEQADPGEKATNPTHWTDAFPLFTHPAPPPSGERSALLQDINKWIGWTNTVGYPDLGRVLGKSADMLAADAQQIVMLKEWQTYSLNEIAKLETRSANPLQQVAVPQGFGALIGIAAWLLSPEPLRLLGELLENKNISRRQFSKALTATNEAYRLKAIEIKGLSDKLAAAPQPPQAERVPMTDAVIDACMQDVAAAALAGIGLPHDKVNAQAPLVVKFAKENLQSYFAVLAARGAI